MTVTTTTKLKKKLISQAIEVLKETKNRNEESGKKALFEDDSSTLFLQVLLKKIPKRNGTQMINVNLPHSLLKDTDEVCLITGDTNKSYRKAETEPDVLFYKALLDKHGVTQVSKVVTLRQLRTDYKPYADKQKLLAAYDVFLADNKIYECLPRVLGKFFYKKRKFPLKIDMKSQNLKKQIEKALSIKRFYVTGNGNCCCSEVATLDMSSSEILANVLEMVNTVSKEMPGAWDNIMGMYLKTARSQSIPIYVSYGNPNDVILPEEEVEDDVIIDELTTKPNVNVKVHNDGRVELSTSKKSQEVCFDEIDKDDVEKEIKSDSQEKNKKRSQKSELKEKMNETGKIKIQKNLDEVDKSEMSLKEKNKVLDEDICVVDPGKKRNKSGKKEVQKNFSDEVDESVITVSKKSKKEKKNVLEEDICIVDPEKKRNKSGKKEVEKNFSDEVDESVITVSKKSKKGKKNVLEEDICIVEPESNIAMKGIKYGDSTKKSKKEKKNICEDSNETPLMTEDLPEKKKKSAFKRKRDLSESGSKEKVAFLSFESPKQVAKKQKVDSENLKKQQPFKNARKKILQQKTKKNFKA